MISALEVYGMYAGLHSAQPTAPRSLGDDVPELGGGDVVFAQKKQDPPSKVRETGKDGGG
jgi:hypothetical protein